MSITPRQNRQFLRLLKAGDKVSVHERNNYLKCVEGVVSRGEMYGRVSVKFEELEYGFSTHDGVLYSDGSPNNEKYSVHPFPKPSYENWEVKPYDQDDEQFDMTGHIKLKINSGYFNSPNYMANILEASLGSFSTIEEQEDYMEKECVMQASNYNRQSLEYWNDFIERCQAAYSELAIITPIRQFNIVHFKAKERTL